MIGEAPKRRDVYRRISQILARNKKTTMDDLTLEPLKNEWPNEEFCRRNVFFNVQQLRYDTRVMGWQKDCEAVWLMRGRLRNLRGYGRHCLIKNHV